jgi:hypothetical protein
VDLVRPRRARAGAAWGRFAWGLFAAVCVLGIIDETLAAALGVGVDPFSIAAFSFPLVGALIVSRQPRNAVGWIMLGLGIAAGLSNIFGIYAYYGIVASPGSLPAPSVALAFDAPMWIPFIGLSGTFLILLFPDGSLPTPRWRFWAYYCAAALVLCYVVLLIAPANFSDAGYPNIRNPLGIDALRPIGGALLAVVLTIPIAIVGCAVALVRRFRRSYGLERVQLKWLAAAAAAVAFSYLIVMVLNFPWVTGGTTPGWILFFTDFAIFTFFLMPAAIGVAILKHRLYDIDVIVNRALVYASLTATLTVVYVAAVAGLGSLLRPLAGQSELAVAGSTLLVAAIFRPARARIQAFVDRHFYRAKFDGEAILQSFTARLRDELDLEALTADVLMVVDQTMKPATSSLWLRMRTAGDAESTT